MWKKSSENKESPVEEEKGAPLGTRLVGREGRAGKRHAIACGEGQEWRARKPGSTAGEGRHRTQPHVPVVGPGGTDCIVELLA